MPYVEADKYCIDGKTYGLYNIYYDDDNYSVIRHSVSKPPFKEKLRLRSYYADPNPADKVFIELKKKNQLPMPHEITLKHIDNYDLDRIELNEAQQFAVDLFGDIVEFKEEE